MILCCGEALIDMLPHQGGFIPHAGGAVFNTAVALGRLGADVALFSGVSNDMFGAQLCAALGASKVDTALLSRSDRPTTLAFVQLVDGQARYAFYDENTAGRMLSLEDLPAINRINQRYKAAFFGGISLVAHPAADSYAALQKRVAEAGVLTMLDPNIRPSFIAGQEAAYRVRMDAMLAQADIVKLSDEDLFWLMGAGAIDVLAQKVLTLGPKLVLITEGAKGAWAFSAENRRFAPAQKVQVVDTVGAGDTFNAGVLAAFAQGGCLSKTVLAGASAVQIDAALHLGVRAAAVTVSRAGANPPWAHELL